MPEDRWMHRKAAASPCSGATWASENAASVYVRVPAETWSGAERFRGVRTSGTG
jgi:hypothetical protein